MRACVRAACVRACVRVCVYTVVIRGHNSVLGMSLTPVLQLTGPRRHCRWLGWSVVHNRCTTGVVASCLSSVPVWTTLQLHLRDRLGGVTVPLKSGQNWSVQWSTGHTPYGSGSHLLW